MDFSRIPKRKFHETVVKLSTPVRKSMVKYASSHSSTLFNSSLGDDVRNFDMSDAFLTPTPQEDDFASNLILELEMDDINSHEIIPSACAIILSMNEKGFTCWTDFFIKSLNGDSSKNLQLVLLKILYNLSTGLSEFKNTLSPCVLRTVLKHFSCGKVNYFALDLINMVLTWQPDLRDTDVDITQLVDWLVISDDSGRREVMKFIFKSVENIVEQWKHLLDRTRLKSMMTSMMERDPKAVDDVKTYRNLHFISKLVANDIIKFEENEKLQVVKWLCDCLANKQNCQLAGETLGLVLNRIIDDYYSDLLDIAEQHVRRLSDKCSLGLIDCAHLIHKFYPPIAMKFMNEAVNAIYQNNRNSFSHSLDLILTFIRREGLSAHEDLKRGFLKFAEKVLESNMESAQEKILQILCEVFQNVCKVDVEELTPKIEELSRHKSYSLRSNAVDVLIKIYRRFYVNFDDALPEDIARSCKTAILYRINDTNADISNKALMTFCGDVSDKLENRIIPLFQNLFEKGIDSEFVEYACRFLLQSCTMTTLFNSAMFDLPLEQCSFTDLKLLVSWRLQHASLAPMFVPSIPLEINRIHEGLPATSQYQLQLRETAQSLMFTPTMTFDSASDVGSEVVAASQNSEAIFKMPKTRRFAKNSSAFFAKLASNKAVQQREKSVNMMKHREKGVQLYRSYRKGDFPDIEIKNSDFVKLLLSLAENDKQFAADLLTELLQSIFNDGAEMISEQITSAFNEVLLNCCDLTTQNVIVRLSLAKRLQLDRTVVFEIAKTSNLLSTSALLIENSISSSKNKHSSIISKRQKFDEEDKTEHWWRLLEVYHKMNDLKTAQGILIDHLKMGGAVKEAIHYEGLFDWCKAAEKYSAVLDDCDLTDRSSEFYIKSYLSCLEKLSSWDGIDECLKSSSGHSALLPWEMRSKMMRSLTSEEIIHIDDDNDNYFGRTTSEPMSPLGRFILENSEDKHAYKRISKLTSVMTVGYWLMKDIGKSISFSHSSQLEFLKNWAILDEWQVNLKQCYHKELQIMTDVQRIVDVTMAGNQSSLLHSYIDDISVELPCEQSDLTVWDVKYHLRSKLHSLTGSYDSFEKSLLDCNLKIAGCAVKQGNFCLSRKYLSKLEKSNKIIIKWYKLKWLSRLVEIQNIESGFELKVKNYTDLWKDIEVSSKRIEDLGERNDFDSIMDCEDSDFPHDREIDPNELHREKNSAILDVLSAILQDCKNNNVALAGVSPDKRNLLEHWLNYANLAKNSVESVKEKGEIYLKLVKFFKEHSKTSWKDVVLNLLKSIGCGNIESRQLFASVLTLEDIEDDTDVEEECEKVPSWMFLQWRHQLVAQIYKKPLKMVENILIRLAKNFPRSLSYSLRITEENLDPKELGSNFFQKLKLMVLSNHLEDRFVNELEKVANPWLKLKYFVEKLERKFTSKNYTEIENLVKKIREVLIQNDTKLIRFSKDVDGIEEYLKKYQTQNGDLNYASEKEDILNILKELFKMLGKTVKLAMASEARKRSSPKLKVYSEFLCDFRYLEHSEVLEIPGQYDGVTEPLPDNHVRIASFKPDVTVLPSLRQPVKITMIGNDAKEYPFLVKFGEDLRQDERIQQVFSYINSKFELSKATEGLQINGYQVIPVTSCCGMIQWLNSVKTLTEFMKLKREDTYQVQQKHLRFLYPETTEPITAHCRGYLVKSEDDVIKAFGEAVRSIPEDQLRQQFWNLSKSPEQFLGLRTNFAKSLSAINIIHWVLGIGDRHLDNVMVDSKTGKLVGIDFGFAFAAATQLLALPELVPFRLTPQMINVLLPLKETWLKQTMIDCLRVLRDDPSILLAVLDVFVNEPCVDWVEQAEKLSREQGGEGVEKTWYPKFKIEAVRRKLMGENPVDEMEADLGQRKEDDVLRRQIVVVRGRKRRARAEFPKSGLSCEDQVSCLLDLATDPLVLGYFYVAWNPWY